MRDNRARLRAGTGPVIVEGAGARPAGFLSPAWRAGFEGPDGWWYTTAEMYLLAKWAEASADGRVGSSGGDEGSDKATASGDQEGAGEDSADGEERESEWEMRLVKFKKVWQRVIQSTNLREQLRLCIEAGLDWSAWREGEAPLASGGC